MKKQLDEAKKQKQNKQKKAQEKKAKPKDYLKKLYGDDLPPPPFKWQDPVEHITVNIFKHEMEESVEKNMKGKKVHFANHISIHTFPPKPDHSEKVDKTISTPPKPVQRLGLRNRLQKSSMTQPSKSTDSEDDLEVLGSVDANDFIFNPLTVPVRKAICVRLNMPFC